MDAAPSTFVLVQGAWIGGRYWRDVAGILRSKGHNAMLERPQETAEILLRAAHA